MTDEDIVEIATILHGKWSDAAIILNTVKGEKDDGSVDWAEFHAIRIENAVAIERMRRELKDRFVGEHRDIISKAFGR